MRNYLTKELVADLDLYLYEQREDELVVVEKDFETIRDRLVDSLVNHGHPIIVVADGDYAGRRELYLRHEWTGRGSTWRTPRRRWSTSSASGAAASTWSRARDPRRGEPQPLVLSYDPREGHSRRGG